MSARLKKFIKNNQDLATEYRRYVISVILDIQRREAEAAKA
jgi:hypothetical protein